MTPEQITAIAERMAKTHYADDAVFDSNMFGHESPATRNVIKGFGTAAKIFIPHLLDLMGRVKHANSCLFIQGVVGGYDPPPECTCGWDDRLTAIKQLIEP